MTTESNTAAATFAPAFQMHHATRAKATKLAAMLAAEYPRLTLVVGEAQDSDHPDYERAARSFHVVFALDTDDEQTVYEGEKVPSLAAILDECAEQDIDPTAPEEEEEPKHSGSVVPEAYRTLYRTVSSTGRSNGDWLAERLAMDTLRVDTLDIEAFIAILLNNGVAMTGKWAEMRFSQTPGWRGRFRMNGRQVLEKMVLKARSYADLTGASHTPSDQWLADMTSKHEKWLAKEAKAEAAATESIKSSVGA